MNWKFLLPIFIISIVFVSGCTSQSNTQSTESTITSSSKSTSLDYASKFDPTNIGEFIGRNEENNIEFYFFLEDNQGRNTVGDGIARLEIKDPTGKIVFSEEFSFESSDFKEYKSVVIGKGYRWVVNENSIEKGNSDIGIAYLTITTDKGRVLTDEDKYIEIPTYTKEEITQNHEKIYLKNAIESGETLTRGDFKVTLVRYGIYKHLKYDDWGDEITDFRADIKVENIGSESESFRTDDAALIAGTKQYDYSYRTDFNTYDIYPGVIKEGYILYKDVPEDISGNIKIIAGSSYYKPVDIHSWKEYLYTFDVRI